jgi:antibiotic biosynthesis monooxygenase (ABM) superfamily enzyme
MGMAIGAPLRHVLEAYVPQPVVALITTAIMVALLTWVVMPNLTKLLRGWLFVRNG